MTSKILWAALGGAAVYWWIKRTCPCKDAHATTAPVAQQSQTQSQSTGGLDDSQTAPAATAVAAAPCSTCPGVGLSPAAPTMQAAPVYMTTLSSAGLFS